jgi:hypothetical protein
VSAKGQSLGATGLSNPHAGSERMLVILGRTVNRNIMRRAAWGREVDWNLRNEYVMVSQLMKLTGTQSSPNKIEQALLNNGNLKPGEEMLDLRFI